MILSFLLLPSLALSALGQGFTPAPVITNNPPTTYTATLFDNPSTSVRGDITASGAPDGVGVIFRVNFTGLPADIGPFPYHVHVSPVPANGDCTAAGEHLDPYNRGEQPPCDPSDPATCQVGDLSGKHGFASGTSFFAEYTDLYLSTDPTSNAFLGDKSVVIHDATDRRLNCGNFQLAPVAHVAGVARLNVAGGSSSTRAHTSTVSNTHTSTRTSSTRPTSTKTSSIRPTSTKTSSIRPTSTETSSTRPTTTHTSSARPTTTHTSSTRPTSTKTSSIRPTSTKTSSIRPTSTEPSSTRPTSTHTSSVRPTTTHTSSTRPTSTHTSSVRPTTTHTSTRTTITRSVPTQPSTFTNRPRTSTRSQY